MPNLIRLTGLFLFVFSAIAILLAYLLPLHLDPWRAFHNEAWFAMAVLCLALLAPPLRSNFEGRIVLSATLLIGCFALLGWASGQAYGYGEDYWLLGAYAALAALAYHVGCQLRQHYLDHLVLNTVASAGILSALIACLQWGGQWVPVELAPAAVLHHPGGNRMVSNIAQANQFGTLCLVALWILWAQLQPWAAKSVARMLAAAAGALVLLVGAYLSGSRTAALNLLLAPVLIGGWSLLHTRRLEATHTNRKFAMWGWVLAATLTWLALSVALPVLIDMLGLPPPPEDRTLTRDDTRLRMWSLALQAIITAPWLGSGPAGMAHAHVTFSPQFGAFDYGIAAHAHNTVLDALVMFGIPLGTLIVAAIVFLWTRAFLAHPSDSWYRERGALLWLAISTVFVHALLEYPLHYGFFLWLSALLLGLILAESSPAKTSNVHAASFANISNMGSRVAVNASAAPTVVRALILGAIVFLIFAWKEYVKVESLYTGWRQQGSAWASAAVESKAFTSALYPGVVERVRWLSFPEESITTLDEHQRSALRRFALTRPASGVLWRNALDAASQGDVKTSAWFAERLCAMFHPELCRAAAEEWRARATREPTWPDLPWEIWLQQYASRPITPTTHPSEAE